LFGIQVGSFNGVDKGLMHAVKYHSDFFPERNKDMYVYTQKVFHRREVYKYYVFKRQHATMLTLSVARPCSNASRM
jgi:hypothetical protein